VLGGGLAFDWENCFCTELPLSSREIGNEDG
jgi:hypothetical protein